ncbi:MAG: hypothetical protein HYU64_12280 [Armatimonadetes bacterium]|nr:hypothetical protein [Armatimonadota bacterium]
MSHSLRFSGRSQDALDRISQLHQAGPYVRSQGDADHSSPFVFQCLKVAQCLGLFENPEGIGFPGDLRILKVLCNQLYENPASISALVELSRGMKESGSITDGCGRF